MQELWEADIWNPTFFHHIWLGLFTTVSNKTFFQSCCKLLICRVGFIYDWCVLMHNHILLFGNSWTTCFWKTNRTRWTNSLACLFLWFESLRFLTLWKSQVYCLCHRIQWCPELATTNNEWIWDDSHNTRNFTGSRANTLQKCSILCWSSEWTLQALCLIFMMP